MRRVDKTIVTAITIDVGCTAAAPFAAPFAAFAATCITNTTRAVQ
jgi:hypothetical protein